MNQDHPLTKGLRQMRAEFGLSALAYNLLRVMNIVGVKALVDALLRRLRALAGALRCTRSFSDWFYALVFARVVRHGKTLSRPPARINASPCLHFRTTSTVS